MGILWKTGLWVMNDRIMGNGRQWLIHVYVDIMMTDDNNV